MLTKDKMKMSPEFRVYLEYMRVCEDFQLKPCSFEEWQIQALLINGHDKHVYIPYISGSGSVWVRKLGNKTSRADRPLDYFLSTVLKP